MKPLFEINERLKELQDERETFYEQMMSHSDLERSPYMKKMLKELDQKIAILVWVLSK
jgi:hypothetical protein